jgi:hypothetical protein
MKMPTLNQQVVGNGAKPYNRRLRGQLWLKSPFDTNLPSQDRVNSIGLLSDCWLLRLAELAIRVSVSLDRSRAIALCPSSVQWMGKIG